MGYLNKMETQTQEVKKVLEKLDKEIREKQSKYVSLIKSLMDDFKGKYFKDKEEGVVKVSIFYIEETKWDNDIEYKKCFYCEDEENNSWWRVDEQHCFEYVIYDLDKLIEAEEITEEEYNKLKIEIINKSKNKELEKISKKYLELKKEVRNSSQP